MLDKKITTQNKFNFSEKKNNTIKSISEVEYFLRNLKKIKKCIKVCKLLK